jgi:protein TonB
MKTDIFSLDWCDLIFEGKNRSYGAYELRKNSPRRHFYALLAACLLVIFSATLPGLIRQIIPKKKEIEVRVRSLTNINLEKPKENNILKELPPTPPPPV